MRPHVVAWLDQLMPRALAALVAPTWFTCIGLAGLTTLFLMTAAARRDRAHASLVVSAVLWGYVAALTAGIAVPMVIDAIEQYVARGRVGWRWAGMTSFWGYLAGAGAAWVVCRRGGLSFLAFADRLAAPAGVALIIARLGCFLAGCDFGKVSSVPWAVRFPGGSPAWRDHVGAGLVPAERAASLPVHPTQLYEAGLGLLLVVVAAILGRRPGWREPPGRVFLSTAAIYAAGRLGIEALRGDAGRGFIAGLSSGQVFSLGVLAVAALAWRWPRRSELGVGARV